MKTLEKVSDFVGKYMAAIVIVVAAGAVLPRPVQRGKDGVVNNLLGIVMFGMGLTLKRGTSRWCSAARRM